jgi:hypothetical protein
LEDNVKWKWFLKGATWPCVGEVEPWPLGDEDIVFKEFFDAGLRLLPHPLVVGALERFNLKLV